MQPRVSLAGAATCLLLLPGALSEPSEAAAQTTTSKSTLSRSNFSSVNYHQHHQSSEDLHFGAKVALSVLLGLSALVALATLLDRPAKPLPAAAKQPPARGKRPGGGRARERPLLRELLLAFSLRTSFAHIFQNASGRTQAPPAGELAATCCTHCAALGPRSRLSSLSNVSEHSTSSTATSGTALSASSVAGSTANLTGAANLLDTVKWSSASIRRPHYKSLGYQSQQSAVEQHSQAERAPETIDSLHGLKFLSMVWVIILHSYDFAWRWSFFTNANDFQRLYKSSVGQLLANGSFACDSFFFATGFLLAYFAFPDQQQQQQQQPSAYSDDTCLNESDFSRTNPAKQQSRLIGNLLFTGRGAEKQQQNTNELSALKAERLNQTIPHLHQQQNKAQLGVQGASFTLRHLLENLLHRYIRMLPLMMAIIGLSTSLLRYLGSGPIWDNSTIMFDKWCRHNWWINGLFLHNFVDRENMCLSHSWYSAVDMQLFLAGQVILYALSRSKRLGLTLLMSMLFGAQAITGTLTILNNLPAAPLALNSSEISLNLYYGYVYIKPYCRASPYMVGMLLAYLMRTTSLGQARLAQWQVIAGWTCSIATIAAILLAMLPVVNGQPVGELEAALYSSLSRTLWACAIGWMVFACLTNHGGLFNSLLSAPLFAPFSRLTYPAFLIHPIVIAAFYGSRPMSFQFSNYLMFYLIIGNIVITYTAALVLSSLFELPLISMEKTLKRKLASAHNSRCWRQTAAGQRNPA